MPGVDDRADAAELLRLGDHVVDERRLPRRLGPEDLDDPAAREAADAEREGEREASRRDGGEGGPRRGAAAPRARGGGGGPGGPAGPCPPRAARAVPRGAPPGGPRGRP